ncbi:MAG: arginine-tRNA-protein transferase [Deltaproteobacteria bacterium]|nr:arginine-tRNA-protein transferase [Deltaproteobacteria bacterium]
MTVAKDDEHFLCLRASPGKMDQLWSQGWRHFGIIFVRYRTSTHSEKLFNVLPLRIDLARFALSRSQKRVLAKNLDTDVVLRPSFIDEEKSALFEKHRVRFNENVPTSLFNFLSPNPAKAPCANLELCIYQDSQLLGVTFLDIGENATSAVYAIFDPAQAKRSLGILMMLHSIRLSRTQGRRYYYPGYAYREPFTYDYKKKFSGLEYLDWDAGWKIYPADAEGAEP